MPYLWMEHDGSMDINFRYFDDLMAAKMAVNAESSSQGSTKKAGVFLSHVGSGNKSLNFTPPNGGE